MTQTQTETPIVNLANRAETTSAGVLEEAISAQNLSALPVESDDYHERYHVWLGLPGLDEKSFYTLRKGTPKEIEEIAAQHPYISWAVKSLMGREHALLVPAGFAEHILFTHEDFKTSIPEGARSYLALREALVGHKCAFEELNSFMDYRQLCLMKGQIYREPRDLRDNVRVKVRRSSGY